MSSFTKSTEIPPWRENNCGCLGEKFRYPAANSPLTHHLADEQPESCPQESYSGIFGGVLFPRELPKWFVVTQQMETVLSLFFPWDGINGSFWTVTTFGCSLFQGRLFNPERPIGQGVGVECALLPHSPPTSLPVAGSVHLIRCSTHQSHKISHLDVGLGKPDLQSMLCSKAI